MANKTHPHIIHTGWHNLVNDVINHITKRIPLTMVVTLRGLRNMTETLLSPRNILENHMIQTKRIMQKPAKANKEPFDNISLLVLSITS